MANVTKPIALDESLNTTENTPRNIADVLASGLSSIANNVKPDGSDISIDVPGMSANNVDDGFSELKQSLTVSETRLVANTLIYLNEDGQRKIVQFRGTTGTTITNGASTTIATLPVGKRPSIATYGVASIGGNTNKFVLILINTNGEITVYNYSGANTDYLYGQVAFMI